MFIVSMFGMMDLASEIQGLDLIIPWNGTNWINFLIALFLILETTHLLGVIKVNIWINVNINILNFLIGIISILGALCLYPGINDTVWTQYGSINQISTISGSIFKQFQNWSIYDNNTAVYYETWTVYNTENITDKSLTMYFDSFDCASWVLR